MATTQTWQAAPSNTSDATFRTWGKGISDAFQALGITKTSDTGQIDWDIVVKGGPVTVAGYEIRQFTDSLQSSNPVYIRIGYGAPSVNANYYFGITLQVGHSIDGACGILGPRTDAIILSYSGTNTTLRDFYASSDGGRLSLVASPYNGIGMTFAFSIERTKDNNGAATTDGVNLVGIGGGYTTQLYQQYLPKLGGPQPATAYTGFLCASPTSGYGTYAGNIGLYPIYPNQGSLGNPDMGAVAYFTADIGGAATVITLSMYGGNHNFITTGTGVTPITINGNSTAASSIAVRYE